MWREDDLSRGRETSDGGEQGNRHCSVRRMVGPSILVLWCLNLHFSSWSGKMSLPTYILYFMRFSWHIKQVIDSSPHTELLLFLSLTTVKHDIFDTLHQSPTSHNLAQDCVQNWPVYTSDSVS